MSRKQCVGVPACAAGWRVEKETCVAAEAVAGAPLAASLPPLAASLPPLAMPLPPPPPMPGDAEPIASAPPPAPPVEEEPAPVKKRFRIGLIIGGASMFAVGYLISVGMAVISGVLATNPSNGACWTYMSNFGFLPFVGPGIGVGAQLGKQPSSSRSSPECQERGEFLPVAAVGIISTALQVVGLVGVAVGFKRVPVNPEANAGIGAPEGVQLSVSAGAPGSLLGVSLRLTNW